MVGLLEDSNKSGLEINRERFPGSKNVCMTTVLMVQSSSAKCTHMLIPDTHAEEQFGMGKERGRNK